MDDGWDCFGTTVYARQEGDITEPELIEALRYWVPALINTDPDGYRTTRELCFASGRLTFVVAVGQMRDGVLWYAVMAVGEGSAPPPEYAVASRVVGQEACQIAAGEGDFDE